MKINFNIHSAGAWTTLLTAIVTAVIGVAMALGIVVKQTDATTIYGSITAIISLLTAFGVLTAATDKQPKDDGSDPKH